VWALESRPRGAGFELASVEQFVWRVLPTDVEFGLDGSLWISDWTEGWNQPRKGRLYRVTPKQQNELVAETAALLRGGVDGLSVAEYEELLAHPDMRVRQRAQFALVERNAVAVLTRQAAAVDRGIARLHAIWGLGQIARARAEVLDPVVALLEDFDVEVRCQAAKVLGSARYRAAAQPLIRALDDRSDRVRFFAAIALGKLGDRQALVPLVDVLRDNGDQDRYLRHAAVMGLAGVADANDLVVHAGDPSSAVRMGVLLAMRRQGRPEIAAFLEDRDPLLRVEAARAIHDVPIPAAQPELAAMLNRRWPDTDSYPDAGMHADAIVRRALAANNRIGDEAAVARMLRFASRGDVDTALRTQAIDLLGNFAKPRPRDPVINLWRPISPRSAAAVTAAFASTARRLLSDTDDRVRVATARAAGKLGVRALGPELMRLARSRTDVRVRRSALEALRTLDDSEIAALAKELSGDADGRLRESAIAILAARDPANVVPLLHDIVAGRSGTTAPRERQNALRVLGDVDHPSADRELSTWMDELAGGKLPAFLELELLEAIEKRENKSLAAKLEAFDDARDWEDPTSDFRESLHGGDRRAGRRIVHESPLADCRRCHETSGGEGLVAPDLKGVGKRLTRKQILEALIDPSRTIAAGYGTITIVKTDESVITGVFKGEKAGNVIVQLPDNREVEVAKADIDSQSQPISAMPAVGGKLSKREIRDLVEFLTTLKR
jgi:quinoprotein glucose dehydrogenase